MGVEQGKLGMLWHTLPYLSWHVEPVCISSYWVELPGITYEETREGYDLLPLNLHLSHPKHLKRVYMIAFSTLIS